MKALLLNDFYTLKDNYTSYLKLMIPMVVVLGFTMHDGGFQELSEFSFMFAPFVVFAMSISMTLFTLEEKSGFMQYAMTTPITRKNYIQGKYIFQVINSLAGALLGGIATVVVAFINGYALTSFDFGWLLVYSAGSFLASMLMCVWTTAMSVKFGVTKGRILLCAVMLIISIAVAASVIVLIQGTDVTMKLIFSVIGGAMLILTIGMFIMSFKWMDRKEF